MIWEWGNLSAENSFTSSNQMRYSQSYRDRDGLEHDFRSGISCAGRVEEIASAPLQGGISIHSLTPDADMHGSKYGGCEPRTLSGKLNHVDSAVEVLAEGWAFGYHAHIYVIPTTLALLFDNKYYEVDIGQGDVAPVPRRVPVVAVLFRCGVRLRAGSNTSLQLQQRALGFMWFPKPHLSCVMLYMLQD